MRTAKTPEQWAFIVPIIQGVVYAVCGYPFMLKLAIQVKL
jgi:hypothetical protein